MKKYLFFLLIVATGACVQPGGSISLTNPHIQVVRELYDAFNAHDWPGMAACYKDTALFLDPSFGPKAVLQTHQQTIEKYQSLQKMFPDIQDEIRNIYGDKNHITVEFISSATGPDGKRWHMPMCTIFTIENGKIIQDNTYYDQQ
ncbi:nuclear transport factor 2 family protein [Chitinophaga sp. MM2321]|uniref:nuclear transport factor 2 family protein n=1 Tax=Chitinophaga sp. MM2321 TaxID=3137178 RepID=UPI0032D58075